MPLALNRTGVIFKKSESARVDELQSSQLCARLAQLALIDVSPGALVSAG